jgi:hypothetical protein
LQIDQRSASGDSCQITLTRGTMPLINKRFKAHMAEQTNEVQQ